MGNRGEKEMKIEPMSVERLRGYVAYWFSDMAFYAIELELALAWIHAEARARESEFYCVHYDCSTSDCNRTDKNKHPWTPGDWIAAVKREVGWPEEE